MPCKAILIVLNLLWRNFYCVLIQTLIQETSALIAFDHHITPGTCVGISTYCTHVDLFKLIGRPHATH